MSNRTASSFGATDQRVYVTNNRVAVFDYNTEQIRLDLSSGNVKVGITGPVSLAPGTLVGLTGPYVYGGLIGVTGNFSSTVTVGAVEISGNVNLNPNTKVGLTGPFIYGDYIGVTGSFQSGPISISAGQVVGITGGITGSVAVTTMPKIDISGVTASGGKLPVYDASATYAINNHSIKAMIDDGAGNLTLENLQGVIDGTGYNSLSVYNYDLAVKLNNDSVYTTAIETTVKNPVGLTGPYIYGNYIGVTGSFQSGPISISAGQFVGITGLAGITGNVSVDNFPSSFGVTGGITGTVSVNNFPSSFGITGGITGAVSITGTANVYDASAYTMLTTIETDISGGILVKGEDDTGTRYPIYTNANGIQRTEIVTGHIETAKYVFSTDATVITSNAGVNWTLDSRGRRPGWYFTGTTSVALNWYANTLSVPPTIDFNKVQSLWMVITPDFVADLPKMRLTTTASVWEYTYSTAIIPSIYNGETFLFYYGQKAIGLHPSVSPRLMSRALISGPGANSEHVTQISILTNSNVGTVYQSAGIWDQTNFQQFETIFSDNNDYVEQNNLMKLSYDASLNLKTVVNGLADASGNFITSKPVTSGLTVAGAIRGLDTASYIMAFNDGLGTPSYQSINCNNVPLTSSTYTSALHVRPFKPIMPAGSEGNVLNNVTITTYGISATVSILDVNSQRVFGKDSFISYRDASPSSTNEICIFGVDGGGAFHAILPSGLPTVTGLVGTGTPSLRIWTTRADLGMFVSLAVKNLGPGSLTGVYLSVLTGQAYSN